MRRARPRLALCLLAALAACGGDEFEYLGTPGTPVAAAFDQVVPTVTARVDVDGDGRERVFLCDTGAPFTVLDATAFPTLGDGKHDVDLDAFALSFPGYGVAHFDLFGGAGGLDGIIGGDLLRHFAFALDYKGGRTWLFDPFDPLALPPEVAGEVAALAGVPITVEGGGLSLLPGDCPPAPFCGTVTVPATRIIARARFEGQADPVWVMVDTGASAIVLSDGLHAALGDAAGRPRLDGVPVTTVYGTEDAFLTRVWRVSLGGAGDADPSVPLDDVPVLVIPGNDLLAQLGAEVGMDVQALVGGMMLRHYFTVIDYPARQLRLAPYTAPTHIDPGEFVGLGFDLAPFGDEWQVVSVYPGTDARAKDVRVDDVVEEIAAVALRGQPPSFVEDQLAAYAVGQAVPLGIRHPGGPVEQKMILIEDLLPSYPPPP